MRNKWDSTYRGRKWILTLKRCKGGVPCPSGVSWNPASLGRFPWPCSDWLSFLILTVYAVYCPYVFPWLKEVFQVVGSLTRPHAPHKQGAPYLQCSCTRPSTEFSKCLWVCRRIPLARATFMLCVPYTKYCAPRTTLWLQESHQERQEQALRRKSNLE